MDDLELDLDDPRRSAELLVEELGSVDDARAWISEVLAVLARNYDPDDPTGWS